MELMNQPITGQLGNRLIELLDSSDYHTLNIVVAFAKNSGVLRIKDALGRFRERGGIVNTYVGVDMGGTSYEALTALLLHTDSLNVVHSENSQTFHPKIYQFLGKDKGLIVVGSHNLTAGGLWTNFESSVIIPLDGLSTNNTLTMGLENYIGELALLEDSFMSIGAQDDIDKLLKKGYVFEEVAERVRLAIAAKQDKPQEPLFGKGVSAELPSITMAKGKKKKTSESNSSHSNNNNQAIWITTKGMTGGSTNIIDLSKKSLVEYRDPTNTLSDLSEYFAPGEEKFMRGTVEFFGQNPTAIDQIKDITLNFDGVDYSGNKILYPVGNKKNGSWRLSMRGTSSSKEKLTDAFRAKGEEAYLKHKIVTFTKIRDDYYSMSVDPESKLEDFKTASRILARNGSVPTARQVGVL